MTARRCELRVEEVILEGVRPADAHRVGAALERELERLIRERGVPERDRAIDTAVPAEVERRPGEPPAVLGARLAGAIYGRLAP